MKKIVERYRSWSWESRLLAILAAIAILPALAVLWESPAVPETGAANMDTHIPRGFVLIPIDVQNYEALDAVFGRFGRVDLYKADQAGQSHEPIAVNVRLLRAPQNPSRFAALVPEGEARQILAHSGSYVAIIKAPNSGGTEFVKTLKRPKRKILYGGG